MNKTTPATQSVLHPNLSGKKRSVKYFNYFLRFQRGERKTKARTARVIEFGTDFKAILIHHNQRGKVCACVSTDRLKRMKKPHNLQSFSSFSWQKMQKSSWSNRLQSVSQSSCCYLIDRKTDVRLYRSMVEQQTKRAHCVCGLQTQGEHRRRSSPLCLSKTARVFTMTIVRSEKNNRRTQAPANM